MLGACRSLLILDDRAAEATCHIPKATGSVVNQVLWARGLQRTPREAAVTTRPTADAFGAADHLLLATSMDETIAVFDVRATAKPWARLRGHCGAVGPNKGAIYQADMTWGACCALSAACDSRLRSASEKSGARTPFGVLSPVVKHRRSTAEREPRRTVGTCEWDTRRMQAAAAW